MLITTTFRNTICGFLFCAAVPYGDVCERDGAGGQSGVALLDDDGVAAGEAVKGRVEVAERATGAAHRNWGGQERANKRVSRSQTEETERERKRRGKSEREKRGGSPTEAELKVERLPTNATKLITIRAASLPFIILWPRAVLLLLCLVQWFVCTSLLTSGDMVLVSLPPLAFGEREKDQVLLGTGRQVFVMNVSTHSSILLSSSVRRRLDNCKLEKTISQR